MATKTKTAKYISRFKSLSIAIKSAHYKTVGEDKVLVPGQRISFEGGYYETSDDGVATALQQRTDFGSAFVRVPDNKTVSEMHDAMTTNDEQKKVIEEQKKEIERLNAQKVDGDESVKLSELTRPLLEEEAKKIGVEEAEIKGAANKGELITLIEKQAEGANFDV